MSRMLAVQVTIAVFYIALNSNAFSETIRESNSDIWGSARELAKFRMKPIRAGAIDPKNDIPKIEVTFSNGVKQNMILRHYNALPNSKYLDHSRLCNYLGHLEGDEENSRVSVTGCLMGDTPDEKMYITLFSKHSPWHKTFSLNNNGDVEHIQLRSKKTYVEDTVINTNLDERSNDKWHSELDMIVNDQIESEAEAVSASQVDSVPLELQIKIRVGYEKSVKTWADANNQNVDNWIAQVMTHFQNWYYHPTLKHKIHFENTAPLLFMHWNNLRVSSSGLSVTADQVEKLNEPDVDLYAWITDGGGSNGIAYTGGACSSRWKTSLTRGPSRYNAIIETAETLVHEVGHNLGMPHDFVGKPAYKNRCRKDVDGSSIPCSQCDNYQPGNIWQPIGPVSGQANDCCNGFMGYSSHPHVWSNCSSRFFRSHYISENWAQCMDTVNTTALKTTTATTMPTTTGSTSAESTTTVTSSPAACNGVPTTDWTCCSSNRPCSLGQGDCDLDTECGNGLKCGNNNCKTDFSTATSDWSKRADCCFKKTAVPTSSLPTTAEPTTVAPTTSDGWTLLSSGSSCSNKKSPWRNANETFLECSAFCRGDGASVLVYRQNNGNCACCDNPPNLFHNTGSSVYTYPATGYTLLGDGVCGGNNGWYSGGWLTFNECTKKCNNKRSCTGISWAANITTTPNCGLHNKAAPSAPITGSWTSPYQCFLKK